MDFQNQLSYEAFFKNPSGQSDNIFEEDDLIQNQNKSATAIMDQEDEDLQIDNIENPFE